MEVTEREQTFLFALPAKPDVCRFDPYNWILKEMDFDKSVGELRLQLRDDDDIAGRKAAAKGLGVKGGSEAVKALETAVRTDRFWGVQAAAAKALGVVRSEQSRDALLGLLSVRDHKARRAVVAALGEFRGDESVFTALVPTARRDQSWFVREEFLGFNEKLYVAAAVRGDRSSNNGDVAKYYAFRRYRDRTGS